MKDVVINIKKKYISFYELLQIVEIAQLSILENMYDDDGDDEYTDIDCSDIGKFLSNIELTKNLTLYEITKDYRVIVSKEPHVLEGIITKIANLSSISSDYKDKRVYGRAKWETVKYCFERDKLFNYAPIKKLNLPEGKQYTLPQISKAPPPIKPLSGSGGFSLKRETPKINDKEHDQYKQQCEQQQTEIKQLQARITELEAQQQDTTKFLTTYITPALECVEAVIKEFWYSYDPQGNQPPPKQETVKAWIKDNHPDIESDSLRLYIDKICRHTNAKAGGNKALNAKDITPKKP